MENSQREQTDIFAQEKATNQAVMLAGNFADPKWYREAEATLNILCRRGEDFTTDDVWRLLDRTGLKTTEPRAMGDIIRKASKAGKIFATGGYRKSIRKECHRRPVAIWRPLGYKRTLRDTE